MAETIPADFPGNSITLTASAAIVGGQLVEVTGNMTVGPAAAASTKVVGMAARDAASGAQVMVFTKGVCYLTAQGAIAAGAKVKAGTVAGSAATIGAGTFDQAVGIALEAIADTAVGRIQLALT